MTNSIKLNIAILLSALLSACSSYDRNDFEFNADELKHFSSYQTGDTIYFKSNLGDVDTITIMGFSYERNENNGVLMAPKPGNGKWVHLKHLPVDSWHGSSRDMPEGKVEIDYQELFRSPKILSIKLLNMPLPLKIFIQDSILLLVSSIKMPSD